MAGGLGQDSLEGIAEAVGIDAPVFFRERTGSTNTDAVAMAERGVPEWSVFAAGHQIAGRGRLGRGWESPPNASLLVSVVLRPALPPDDLPLLSLLAATAMAEACRSVAGVEVRVKWPNDLLVGDRKLGGVLAEARVVGGRVEHAVVGIGVNVEQTPADFPEGLRGRATSLLAEGAEPDQGALLEGYLRRLWDGYRPGDPGFGDAVVGEARALSATLRRRVAATTLAGRVVEGVAVDLDGRGNLVLDVDGRRETVLFGEVEHLL